MEMETKRTTGIKVSYDHSIGQMTWTDIEGKSPAITLHVADLSDEIKRAGLWHGLDQKVTDAGAMGMGNWDGDTKPKRYATTAERMQRMRRVADNLAAGSWNVRASADPLANASPEQLAALIKAAQGKLAALGIVESETAE
jgi:hypothetical protein